MDEVYKFTSLYTCIYRRRKFINESIKELRNKYNKDKSESSKKALLEEKSFKTETEKLLNKVRDSIDKKHLTDENYNVLKNQYNSGVKGAIEDDWYKL